MEITTILTAIAIAYLLFIATAIAHNLNCIYVELVHITKKLKHTKDNLNKQNQTKKELIQTLKDLNHSNQ